MRIEQDPRLSLDQSRLVQGLTDILKKIGLQLNGVTEGRISAHHGASVAAPTTGTWAQGDFIKNSAPSGATPTMGWVCTAGGTPGTWVAVATGGGGGTPAGSNLQVQYNNGGAFGAEAGFEYDAATNTLTVQNLTSSTGGRVLTAASATGGSGLRVPHGAAPTTPTNGDVWTTTTGLFARINGATVGPYIASASITGFTASLNTASPNNTVNASRMLASGGSTDQDAVWQAKGAGATLAQLPDATSAGGDKRGSYATDFSKSRTSSDQVASGASSTIGGGQKNKASGASATVAGGDTNAATNTAAIVGGGSANQATGTNATVGGGDSNTASGDGSTIGGGGSNTAGGTDAFVGGGYRNAASGNYSAILGGFDATTRGLFGVRAFSAGRISNQGDSQEGTYQLRALTSNATQTALTADANAASAINGIVLPDGSAYSFRALVVAKQSATAAAAGWEVKGMAMRGSGVGTIAFVGTPTVTALGASAGAATWALAVAANTTQGSVELRGTGEAAKTIVWSASVLTVEVVV